MELSRFDYHRAAGIHYGYNECCVLFYCNLIIYGVPPALYAHFVCGHDHNLDYVLCNKCYIAHKKRNPEEHMVGTFGITRREFFIHFGRNVAEFENDIAGQPTTNL